MCGTGTYYNQGANACFECPAGKFSTSGAKVLDDCEDCAQGFVSTGAGKGFCSARTPGKRASLNSTTCVACASGSFSGVAALECESCEAGKYVRALSLPPRLLLQILFLTLASLTQVRWLKQLRHMRNLHGQQGHQQHRGQLGVHVQGGVRERDQLFHE
jgi:hypothetical protein